MSDDTVELDAALVEVALEQLENAQQYGETAMSHDEVRTSTAMLATATQGAYRALVKAHPDYELKDPEKTND